ncbi:MAG: HAD family phosphatase, partial [Planctomycetota bacterium]
SAKSGLKPGEVHEILFRSGLETDFDLGRIDADTFAQKVIGQLGLKIEIEEVRKAWEAIFSPMEGMEELVKSLKNQYRLILLSNTNPWHFEYCCRWFPFLKLFDASVLSYVLGCRKPDPEIYRKALVKAGQAPEECLYIDDVEAYVVAASELGIKSICFHGVEPLKSELFAHGVLLA